MFSLRTLLAVLLALCLGTLLWSIWMVEGLQTIPSRMKAILQDTKEVYIPNSSGIPKLLWYKLGPKGLSNDARTWTSTCTTANPDYKAEFLTDESATGFVKEAFADRPDIVENYLNLSVPILKADMLRYLLLYDQSGIWSDLDVSCEKPIDEWIPAEFRDKAALVVDWEFDFGWGSGFTRQFASWTIMAKPNLPHLMQVIDDVVATLERTREEHSVSVAEVTLNMTGDVVDFSGPRRLTFSVFKSLGRALNRTVDPNAYKEILQPRLVEDVLIMPGKSFAAGSNTYLAEQEGQLPPVLVTHHYAGFWKNDHGGEQRRK